MTTHDAVRTKLALSPVEGDAVSRKFIWIFLDAERTVYYDIHITILMSCEWKVNSLKRMIEGGKDSGAIPQ